MSPVSPKPCNSSTAGPDPPTRTCNVPPVTAISRALKFAENGLTSANRPSGDASNERRGEEPREHKCGRLAMRSVICASHALFAPPKISHRRLIWHRLEAAPRSRP